jgi:hypothetical protein
MAFEHVEWPTFGLQFHPESVLTDCGHRLLRNFLEVAGLRTNSQRADSLGDVDQLDHLETDALHVTVGHEMNVDDEAYGRDVGSTATHRDEAADWNRFGPIHW